MLTRPSRAGAYGRHNGEFEMKTQMRFQKIFMLVSLIIAALCVVYALVFCSGILYQTSKLYNAQTGEIATARIDRVKYTATGADEVYAVSQNVSSVLLILGIVMICCVVLNYVMGTQKRRNYYITNYIAIGVVVAYALALAATIIAMVANCHSALFGADVDVFGLVYNANFADEYNLNDAWMFPVGYALAAILIVDAIGFVLNLVWKIKLMQGEKALLQSGLVKEVA